MGQRKSLPFPEGRATVVIPFVNEAAVGRLDLEPRLLTVALVEVNLVVAQAGSRRCDPAPARGIEGKVPTERPISCNNQC